MAWITGELPPATVSLITKAQKMDSSLAVKCWGFEPMFPASDLWYSKSRLISQPGFGFPGARGAGSSFEKSQTSPVGGFSTTDELYQNKARFLPLTVLKSDR